jgi:phosphomevalonate decarboxylase
MKSTAIAHPIQGLIKYHGLKSPKQRIPFHDSISVCAEALSTITTVETNIEQTKDIIIINDQKIVERDLERVNSVIGPLKSLAKYSEYLKIVSKNSLTEGKGLGFSASGFAALGLATSRALELKLDKITLSEIVRLGAGSATRSLAGGFSIWYAEKTERSYAEQLASPNSMDFTQIIVPISSDVKTDEAHLEVLSSPLFKTRLEHLDVKLESMKRAIENGDVPTIGRLAEEDTLNLHAITMTGRSHRVLWEPETVKIIKEVVKMREEGVPAWYSMDTGPSVFINTVNEYLEHIVNRLESLRLPQIVVSRVGDKASIIQKHLF